MVLILFAVGIILVIKGGDIFVDAALWVSRATQIPMFIIGATVVSLATTMPEVFVSVIASSNGMIDMAIGNAIGTVICNAGLILGISILVLPIKVRRFEFAGKGILMLSAASLLLMLCFDGRLTYKDNLLMFGILTLYIMHNIHSAQYISSGQQKTVEVCTKTIFINIIKFVFGALAIVMGANLLVDNGAVIARHMGVPEGVIGLSMLALGTSLPELVTTISAIAKREFSLSVGNIIGANIIDMCLIMPLCSMVSSKEFFINNMSIICDIPILILITFIVVIPPMFTGRFRRIQGLIILIIYVAYLVIRM